MTFSETEIAALTRFAGIPTTPERLPILIREAAAIQSLIADLDGIPTSTTDPADTPFDPARNFPTTPEHQSQ